jgi:Xaa-Pro aminopeptidase
MPDPKQVENLLMVADSEHDANMLYAVGMFVPDPFIYLKLRGRDHIVMSDLEIDRARKSAPHCRILAHSLYQKKLRKRGVKQPGFAHVIAAILRERGTRKVTVPHGFPYGLARELQKQRIAVSPRPGNFFSGREHKRNEEVKKISASLMMAEVGMAEAMQVLRSCRIARDRRLMHQNLPLTSEKLRSVIEIAILKANGQAAHTIVAGGKQGCDPHERGYGPLRAHEPIIIDIFPRSMTTGYFGDITRTVVRGRATEAVRKLYDTVLQAQEVALKKMRPGIPTLDVHKAVQDFFESHGYTTGRKNGRMQGFFHGTGHGLGLEIHEAPRMGINSSGTIQAGQVVTVEPGLYYPAIGAVRIEDAALITRGAPRNLTRFEKVLEI